MVNNVVLIGRLTRDPELRKTQNGDSVTNFTLAVNRTFGKDKDKADFIRCVAWGQTAEFMAQYLGKGALVSVEGRIETGSYQDTDGKTVFTTDIVTNSVQALESREQREQNQGGQTLLDAKQQYDQGFTQEDTFDGPELDISSDDLPFS